MDDAVIVWDEVIESYDEEIKTIKSCTKYSYSLYWIFDNQRICNKL